MVQRRNTPQRRVIESILEQSSSPMLPKELHEKVQETMPKLGIATIFRALKDLVDQGSARAVNVPGDSSRYETVKRVHHHHFKCTTCQQVYCIEGCPGNLDSLLSPGFELLDHDITLFGSCATCSQK